jgi:Uma2 family endonuclease
VTSQPHEPGHPYTVDEFTALSEDNSLRYELQEGLLIVSPRPAKPHMRIVMQLGVQLSPQLPPELDVLPEVDVRLEGLPATVRVPDLVVVNADSVARPGLVLSSEVAIAIEVMSPGSIRLDSKVKMLEYADAGIPHYWLVDPEPPVTATMYRLVDGVYQESLRAAGVVEIRKPAPLRIDLDGLLPTSKSG